MALTNTQIRLLLNGNPKPAETTFSELVAIAGAKHANWFSENEKSTDPDTLAWKYATKVKNITTSFTHQDEDTIDSVTYNLLIKAGNIINYTDVLEYTTTDWEALADDYIVSAIEVVGGVTQAEKLAYDGL